MKEQNNFSFLENEFFPSPFNYAGQKFPELQELFSLFPKDKETLVDLFVGGGSVAINSGYKNIIINDKLTTLIDFYKELHDLSFEQLIENILKFKINSKEEFLSLRQSFNDENNCYKFFSLLSSCTNNLIRFNKKGKFNQTYGKRTINDKTIEKLKKYHQRIKQFDKVEIYNKNFDEVEIPDNSFVYCDPPYIITEAGYNCCWTKTDEIKLYDYLIFLDKIGVKWGISNVLYHKGVKNEFMNKILKFNVHEMKTFRNKAKKVQEEKTLEVFISNY